MGRRTQPDADGQGMLMEGVPAQGSTYNSTEREQAREYMSRKRHEGRIIRIRRVDAATIATREEFRYNLLGFCLAYFAWLFYLPLAGMHQAIIAELEEAILRGGKIALAAPRGFGKTTITLVAIIWAIVYGHAHYIVLVCAEGGLARDRLDDLKTYFDDKDSMLTRDFPEVCEPVIALQGAPQRASKQLVDWSTDKGTRNEDRTRIKWGVDSVQFAKVPAPDGSGKPADASGAIIVAKGLDSAIRGLVKGDKRPDLVLADDPQTNETARSEHQTKTRNEILRKDIEGLVGPGEALTIISLWTVIQAGDLADRYTSNEEPDFFSMRFKAIEVMPSDQALVDEYIARVRDAKSKGDKATRLAHAWYILNREKIEAGALASWPDNYVRKDVGDQAVKEADRIARAA